MVESRFGQSIRMGSTVLGSSNLNTWSSQGAANSPITIIRNGQGKIFDTDKFKMITEDINRDNAAIWLTAGQKINISNIERFPLKSFDRYKTVIASRTTTVETVGPSTRYSTSAAEQDRKSLS
jgi:hypothetical protein